MKKIALLALALFAYGTTSMQAARYNGGLSTDLPTYDDIGTPMVKPTKLNVCKALISRLNQAADVIDDFSNNYGDHLTNDTKDRLMTLKSQLKDFECAKVQQLKQMMEERMSDI